MLDFQTGPGEFPEAAALCGSFQADKWWKAALGWLGSLNPGLRPCARHQNSLSGSRKLSESSPCIGKAGSFVGSDANTERRSGCGVNGKFRHL